MLQRGLTLVELVIGLAIAGFLLVMGLPSFSGWIQNTQIRNAAEAIQNGLQLARAEAVRRNTAVQFVLTSVAGGSAGSDWTISCVSPVDVDGDGIADCPGTGMTPAAIQTYSSTEGSRKAAIVTGTPTIVFNGMGRMTTPAAGATVNVRHVSDPTGANCAAAGGSMRCLDVRVATGGEVRMCDQALTATRPTDPRAC